MFDLLEAGASTVIYEAASSLTALTTNPVAVRAAASKLIELSIRESDNNVKLIVLDRVDQLRKKNEGILDDLTMETLRVLSSPDIDVRKKALSIALDMVSGKNVEEVVMLLKKELSKTVDQDYEKVLSLSLPFPQPQSGGTNRPDHEPEQRIPSSLSAIHPSMRHQILRGGGQRR